MEEQENLTNNGCHQKDQTHGAESCTVEDGAEHTKSRMFTMVKQCLLISLNLSLEHRLGDNNKENINKKLIALRRLAGNLDRLVSLKLRGENTATLIQVLKNIHSAPTNISAKYFREHIVPQQIQSYINKVSQYLCDTEQTDWPALLCGLIDKEQKQGRLAHRQRHAQTYHEKRRQNGDNGLNQAVSEKLQVQGKEVDQSQRQKEGFKQSVVQNHIHKQPQKHQKAEAVKEILSTEKALKLGGGEENKDSEVQNDKSHQHRDNHVHGQKHVTRKDKLTTEGHKKSEVGIEREDSEHVVVGKTEKLQTTDVNRDEKSLSKEQNRVTSKRSTVTLDKEFVTCKKPKISENDQEKQGVQLETTEQTSQKHIHLLVTNVCNRINNVKSKVSGSREVLKSKQFVERSQPERGLAKEVQKATCGGTSDIISGSGSCSISTPGTGKVAANGLYSSLSDISDSELCTKTCETEESLFSSQRCKDVGELIESTRSNTKDTDGHSSASVLKTCKLTDSDLYSTLSDISDDEEPSTIVPNSESISTAQNLEHNKNKPTFSQEDTELAKTVVKSITGKVIDSVNNNNTVDDKNVHTSARKSEEVELNVPVSVSNGQRICTDNTSSIIDSVCNNNYSPKDCMKEKDLIKTPDSNRKNNSVGRTTENCREGTESINDRKFGAKLSSEDAETVLSIDSGLGVQDKNTSVNSATRNCNKAEERQPIVPAVPVSGVHEDISISSSNSPSKEIDIEPSSPVPVTSECEAACSTYDKYRQPDSPTLVSSPPKIPVEEETTDTLRTQTGIFSPLAKSMSTISLTTASSTNMVPASTSSTSTESTAKVSESEKQPVSLKFSGPINKARQCLLKALENTKSRAELRNNSKECTSEPVTPTSQSQTKDVTGDSVLVKLLSSNETDKEDTSTMSETKLSPTAVPQDPCMDSVKVSSGSSVVHGLPSINPLKSISRLVTATGSNQPELQTSENNNANANQSSSSSRHSSVLGPSKDAASESICHCPACVWGQLYRLIICTEGLLDKGRGLVNCTCSACIEKGKKYDFWITSVTAIRDQARRKYSELLINHGASLLFLQARLFLKLVINLLVSIHSRWSSLPVCLLEGDAQERNFEAYVENGLADGLYKVLFSYVFKKTGTGNLGSVFRSHYFTYIPKQCFKKAGQVEPSTSSLNTSTDGPIHHNSDSNRHDPPEGQNVNQSQSDSQAADTINPQATCTLNQIKSWTLTKGPDIDIQVLNLPKGLSNNRTAGQNVSNATSQIGRLRELTQSSHQSQETHTYPTLNGQTNTAGGSVTLSQSVTVVGQRQKQLPVAPANTMPPQLHQNVKSNPVFDTSIADGTSGLLEKLTQSSEKPENSVTSTAPNSGTAMTRVQPPPTNQHYPQNTDKRPEAARNHPGEQQYLSPAMSKVHPNTQADTNLRINYNSGKQNFMPNPENRMKSPPNQAVNLPTNSFENYRLPLSSMQHRPFQKRNVQIPPQNVRQQQPSPITLANIMPLQPPQNVMNTRPASTLPVHNPQNIVVGMQQPNTPQNAMATMGMPNQMQQQNYRYQDMVARGRPVSQVQNGMSGIRPPSAIIHYAVGQPVVSQSVSHSQPANWQSSRFPAVPHSNNNKNSGIIGPGSVQNAGIHQPRMNQPGFSQLGVNQLSMNQSRMNHPGLNQPTLNQSGMNQAGVTQPMLNQPNMNQPGMNQSVNTTTWPSYVPTQQQQLENAMAALEQRWEVQLSRWGQHKMLIDNLSALVACRTNKKMRVDLIMEYIKTFWPSLINWLPLQHNKVEQLQTQFVLQLVVKYSPYLVYDKDYVIHLDADEKRNFQQRYNSSKKQEQSVPDPTVQQSTSQQAKHQRGANNLSNSQQPPASKVQQSRGNAHSVPQARPGFEGHPRSGPEGSILKSQLLQGQPDSSGDSRLKQSEPKQTAKQSENSGHGQYARSESAVAAGASGNHSNMLDQLGTVSRPGDMKDTRSQGSRTQEVVTAAGETQEEELDIPEIHPPRKKRSKLDSPGEKQPSQSTKLSSTSEDYPTKPQTVMTPQISRSLKHLRSLSVDDNTKPQSSTALGRSDYCSTSGIMSGRSGSAPVPVLEPLQATETSQLPIQTIEERPSKSTTDFATEIDEELMNCFNLGNSAWDSDKKAFDESCLEMFGFADGDDIAATNIPDPIPGQMLDSFEADIFDSTRSISTIENLISLTIDGQSQCNEYTDVNTLIAASHSRAAGSGTGQGSSLFDTLVSMSSPTIVASSAKSVTIPSSANDPPSSPTLEESFTLSSINVDSSRSNVNTTSIGLFSASSTSASSDSTSVLSSLLSDTSSSSLAFEKSVTQPSTSSTDPATTSTNVSTATNGTSTLHSEVICSTSNLDSTVVCKSLSSVDSALSVTHSSLVSSSILSTSDSPVTSNTVSVSCTVTSSGSLPSPTGNFTAVSLPDISSQEDAVSEPTVCGTNGLTGMRLPVIVDKSPEKERPQELMIEISQEGLEEVHQIRLSDVQFGRKNRLDIDYSIFNLKPVHQHVEDQDVIVIEDDGREAGNDEQGLTLTEEMRTEMEIQKQSGLDKTGKRRLEASERATEQPGHIAEICKASGVKKRKVESSGVKSERFLDEDSVSASSSVEIKGKRYRERTVWDCLTEVTMNSQKPVASQINGCSSKTDHSPSTPQKRHQNRRELLLRGSHQYCDSDSGISDSESNSTNDVGTTANIAHDRSGLASCSSAEMLEYLKSRQKLKWCDCGLGFYDAHCNHASYFVHFGSHRHDVEKVCNACNEPCRDARGLLVHWYETCRENGRSTPEKQSKNK